MDGNQTNLDGILTKYRTQQSFFAISFHFLGQFIFTPIPKGGGDGVKQVIWPIFLPFLAKQILG